MVDFIMKAINALDKNCEAVGVILYLQKAVMTDWIIKFFQSDFIALECESYHWHGLILF